MVEAGVRTFRLETPTPAAGVMPVEDWDQAQGRANFVLIGPASSSPWRIEGATLRGESKEHYATLRYRLVDGRRRLRVKQYWHDWWIPTIP